MERKHSKINNKIFMIIGILGLLSLVGGISIAFFNYTRTGGENVVKTGRISFTSSQTTMTLANVFPVDSDNINSDTDNVITATVTVTGDTTYPDGIEYLLTATNVQNRVNGKQVPLSINVTAGNGLGTSDSSYFTNRETTNESIYKVISDETIYTNNDLLVGYIVPGETGIEGTITIKAYFDKDKIGISDTYPEKDIDLNNDEIIDYTDGTTSEWARGRTILTTSEWNSMQTNGISFQIKVEANEGIWVNNKNIVMKNIYEDTNWTAIRANVTSIEFSTDGIVPSNAITSFDVTDITSTHPVTLYTLDDGLGNNTYKAVIVSNGAIYAPENSSYMFSFIPKLITFDSTNFKVDNVTNMSIFFYNDFELVNISTLSQWNTSNVENISGMFGSGNANNHMKLNDISALSTWDVSNVENMTAIFQLCSHLTNVDALLNWDVSNVKTMYGLFYRCENLVNIDGLARWDVSSVENMRALFNDTDIFNLSPIANWRVGSVKNMRTMFAMDDNKMYKTGNPIIDLTPLVNWDVSNVEDMSVMFQNVILKSLIPLAKWDTGKVTSMKNMFKCNSIGGNTITTLAGLENWAVSNVDNYEYMFVGFNNLTDASAINDWDIKSTASFKQMFNGVPVHPEFTKVSGTWNSKGTFTPSA